MGIAQRKIEDANLIKAVTALTPEKIQEAVRTVTKGEAGARLALYHETCMRCGMCAEACHFSLSHKGDPSYTPVGKMKQTMWRLLRTEGRVKRIVMGECGHAFRSVPVASGIL